MALHRPGLPCLTGAPSRVVVHILFRGSVPRVSPVYRGVGRDIELSPRVVYGGLSRRGVEFLDMRPSQSRNTNFLIILFRRVVKNLGSRRTLSS